VFGVVAVLALGVLAFGSLRVALLSNILNLLSVGAAYGVITLIFQDGRLQGVLNYTAFGGIIFWVPLFMFVFLFGISMDYHVFLLSRIKERGSIVDGIASSAGVITSAALIMVAVFSVFATLSLVDLKILGVGTAVAVLLDATLVRGVLPRLPDPPPLGRPPTSPIDRPYGRGPRGGLPRGGLPRDRRGRPDPGLAHVRNFVTSPGCGWLPGVSRHPRNPSPGSTWGFPGAIRRESPTLTSPPSHANESALPRANESALTSPPPSR
jgi:signal transduction histidine kinase